MTTVVDHYGTFLPPQLVDGGSLTPTQLALALDGLRSAVRDKGWLATDASLSANATTGVVSGRRAIVDLARGVARRQRPDLRRLASVGQSRRHEPGRTRRDN